jgi:hypothetical protein
LGPCILGFGQARAIAEGHGPALLGEVEPDGATNPAGPAGDQGYAIIGVQLKSPHIVCLKSEFAGGH